MITAATARQTAQATGAYADRTKQAQALAERVVEPQIKKAMENGEFSTVVRLSDRDTALLDAVLTFLRSEPNNFTVEPSKRPVGLSAGHESVFDVSWGRPG